MKRTVSRVALVCALAALALITVSLFQVTALPDMLIYSVSAPEVQAGAVVSGSQDAPLDDAQAGDGTQADNPPATVSTLEASARALRTAMEPLKEYITAYALTGYAHGVSVGDGDKLTKTADLFALSERAAAVDPMLFIYGRMLYDDELRYGDRVAMLSSQLAVDLFRMSDVTGKHITIDGEQYRVVGVVRRSRQVGDTSLYQVYLPLKALSIHGKTALTQLTLRALPLPGSGAAVNVETVARAWRPEGSYYQTSREKVRALLIPRVLLGLLWLYVIAWLFKGLYALGARFVKWVRGMMRDHYFTALIWRILPGALAGLVMLGALLAVCYVWAGFMMEPVLLFPEWVPEVPVEFADIEKTFWALQTQASAQVKYLTPEMARMGFFGSLGTLGAILMLAALGLQLGHWVRRKGER